MSKIKIISCAKMKEAEAFAIRSGISSSRLMENAGSAAARFIRGVALLDGVRCAVVCGCGNNGGDGFVVARRLTETGAQISVILACGLPRTQEASEMYERLHGLPVEVLDYGRDRHRCTELIPQCGIIVDAVFGTGFRGSADDTLSELFRRINTSAARIFALDIPSGADADTGAVPGQCIRAEFTITFAAAKTGHFLSPACDFCGSVNVVNIGIPDEAFPDSGGIELIDPAYCRSALPVRRRESNKGDYGRVLCLCGSLTMPGAAAMSSAAAARCGAGLVTLAVPKSIYAPLAAKTCEVMTVPLEETESGSVSLRARNKILELASRCTAVLIGCGLSHAPETCSLVRDLLGELDCAVVLDADGINAVAGHINILRDSRAKLILTPHPGEMSRLCGLGIPEIQADRAGTARRFAGEYGVTLVLKGSGTIVAQPDGSAHINPTGNPGMARGGSGDILAGMIAGFAAQGIGPNEAACAAVYIHGLAGDRCAAKLSQYGMLPTDMLCEIPQIFREMSR
jgi:hydroxyethylthiazole kinase-like uncharacterized protein yjeF